MKFCVIALLAYLAIPTSPLSTMCPCIGVRKKYPERTEKHSDPTVSSHTEVLQAAQQNELAACSIILEKALPGHKSMLLHASTSFGATPLHLACMNNNTEMAILLLLHGAIINQRDVEGRTALYYAAMCGNETLVQRLLEMGAVIDSKEDRSPLAIAAQRGHLSIISLFLALHGPLCYLFDEVTCSLNSYEQCTLCKNLLSTPNKGFIIAFCTCKHVVHLICFHQWVCVERQLLCPVCKKGLGSKKYKNTKNL